MAVFEKSMLVRRAWEVLEPELREQGYELVEVEYGQYGGAWTLRLFIDKDGGVTLDDCQAVSQLAGPVLDMQDLVAGRYVLEVSSPGIDRPVRKPADFARFAGECIAVVSHTAIAGRKKFKGILKGFHDGLVAIECNGSVCEVHIENVKKARLER